MRVIHCQSPEERQDLPQSPALPSFDANQIRMHFADTHLCAISSAGDIRAFCSLWWKETPQLPGHKLGAIGHYASADDESAAGLISAALARLGEQGSTLAVGPMDGNTWRRYRFVTDAGSPQPTFFLEPSNPPDWPRQFELAGFTPLSQYFSALNADLSRIDPRLAPIQSRLAASGVHICSAAGTDLLQQLKRIYHVSRIAFVHNFLYTELPESAFLAQYVPLLPRIQPELILLAKRDSALVGYLFAIPDFAQSAHGVPMDTFLIKTVAILPDPSLRGLGGLLVGLAHQVGHALGYRRCIHALMHQGNASRRISNHYATTMRQYTLYSREIAP